MRTTEAGRLVFLVEDLVAVMRAHHAEFPPDGAGVEQWREALDRAIDADEQTKALVMQVEMPLFDRFMTLAHKPDRTQEESEELADLEPFQFPAYRRDG